MPAIKEQLVADIGRCRSADLDERAIARKMFLIDPTFVFKEDSIAGYKILRSISQKFRVPIGCIKIAGSSQLGYSSFQNQPFIPGESDLDIAIVNPNLFQRYCEIVYDLTNGYRDQTGFKDQASYQYYQEYLQNGYFRPDLMPLSKQKTEWFDFFKTITKSHSIQFKDVNGGIYFSETFFESKQVAVIRKLTEV